MIRLRAQPASVRQARQQRNSDTRSDDTNLTPDRHAAYIEQLFDDGAEGMAERDCEIGRRAHALIARFCRAGAAPEPTQVWVATGRLFAASPMVLNHSSKQRAACAVSSYFLRFHRPDWQFFGAEVALDTGRVDLLWRLPSGRYIIDEIKTGALSDAVEDRPTLEQVGRYVAAGRTTWGDDFAGVRLLPLTCPGRARFYTDGTVAVALRDAASEVR